MGLTKPLRPHPARSGAAGTRFLLGFIAVSILAVTIISFGSSIHKPFTLDEIEEARMAEKINIMGPKTYLPKPEGGGEPLTHPLLYSYVNGLIFKFFGAGEVALRGHGVFWYILSLVVLLRLVKVTLDDIPGYSKSAILLASSLYLLNPLLIQHSMLINNSDNNILAFAIILFVYLFFIFEKKTSISFLQSRLILALVVCFSFMCKEITPVFLMLSVIIYRLINREFKKLWMDLVFNIGLGVLLFCLAWYLYCHFTGTDILAFIKFTIVGKGKKVTLDFLLGQFKYFFLIWKWPLYWASAPFFALVFIALFERLKIFIRTRRLAGEDFVLLSAIVIFTPYHFVKASIDMMKYQYPTYPLFIFIITWLIQKRLFHTGSDRARSPGEYKKLIYVIVVLLVIFSPWYYIVGDYIMILWNKVSFQFLARYYIPIIIGLVSIRALFRKWGSYRTTLCALLIFIYPINIGLNLNQTRDYTTAVVWLNYGEKGIIETAEHLKANADPRFILYARKDIDYYLRYRHGVNIRTRAPTYVFLTRDEKILNALFERVPIQYFVFDRVSSVQRANKDILFILNRYFFLEKRCGDFVILKHKRFLQER